MAKVGIKEGFLFAFIPTIAQIFISFFTQYPDVDSIRRDPEEFLYNFIKFTGATYFFSLCGILGLTKYLDTRIESED